jgi:hypothetical protein
MPFDWRHHEGHPLEERFDRETIGFDPWYGFLREIAEIDGLVIDRSTTEADEKLLLEFAAFLDRIDSLTPQSPAEKMQKFRPMVFVSHQRSDLAEAERIAFLASGYGIDYWLDIHDPVLALANRKIPPHDLRYPLIIGAIIEMALLNSTCLIAVHSLNSLTSKWVPYELGRVRDRSIQSANVGGWFHPAIRPSQCGDYVHLCRISRGGEQDVTSWLSNWTSVLRANPGWPAGSATKPLPT